MRQQTLDLSRTTRPRALSALSNINWMLASVSSFWYPFRWTAAPVKLSVRWGLRRPAEMPANRLYVPRYRLTQWRNFLTRRVRSSHKRLLARLRRQTRIGRNSSPVQSTITLMPRNWKLSAFGMSQTQLLCSLIGGLDTSGCPICSSTGLDVGDFTRMSPNS